MALLVWFDQTQVLQMLCVRGPHMTTHFLGHGTQIDMQLMWRVDVAAVLDAAGVAGSPSALAGCRLDGTNSESCLYDLVVFDGSSAPPSLVRWPDGAAIIYHASLDETRYNILLGFADMRVIRDESMTLAPFLEGVRRRRDALFAYAVRDCSVESILCAHRALQADVDNDASYWQKCATLYLGDALLLSSGRLPSSHTLGSLRQAGAGSGVSALVSRSLGVERATPSLLDRMGESAAALAALVSLVPSDIVRFKAMSLRRDGRLADCYYYLCSVGRDAALAPGGSVADKTTIQYASQIALDTDRDAALARKDALDVHKAAARLLDGLAGR